MNRTWKQDHEKPSRETREKRDVVTLHPLVGCVHIDTDRWSDLAELGLEECQIAYHYWRRWSFKGDRWTLIVDGGFATRGCISNKWRWICNPTPYFFYLNVHTFSYWIRWCLRRFLFDVWLTPPGWCHLSFYSLSSQELPAIDCFANSEPPEEKYWKPLWEVLGRGVFGTWVEAKMHGWCLPSFRGSRIWKNLVTGWLDVTQVFGGWMWQAVG